MNPSVNVTWVTLQKSSVRKLVTSVTEIRPNPNRNCKRLRPWKRFGDNLDPD